MSLSLAISRCWGRLNCFHSPTHWTFRPQYRVSSWGLPWAGVQAGAHLRLRTRSTPPAAILPPPSLASPLCPGTSLGDYFVITLWIFVLSLGKRDQWVCVRKEVVTRMEKTGTVFIYEGICWAHRTCSMCYLREASGSSTEKQEGLSLFSPPAVMG